MGTFELLNKNIQKAIFDLKWENFRPIQDEAIEHLIKNPSDLIISAPTASGKTEAAFLPIISEVADTGKTSIKVLYISPLKALINDQFERVTKLCNYIDFPITKWHGDANATKKANLIKNPKGILLITPESIEALILNKTQEIGNLLGELDYIVIDEIHSFIGTERGTHLRSLIRRIENGLDIQPLKIGLSATINNVEDVAKWLNPTNPKSVKIIKDSDDEKEIMGLIKGYKIPAEDVDNDFTQLEKELFDILKKDKNLIFANSKMTLEAYCDTMQQIAKENVFPNNFLIHHGSLSKEIREHAEKSLKTSTNLSVFCTNTLELGIDIGNIDRIIFLDPPFSVAAMTQRLGRSGRRENSAKEFRFMISAREIDDKSTWDDKFRIDLVQSIAIVELMLAKWCEPLDVDKVDYSTFVHQILSYLGQTGGATAQRIYNTIGAAAFNKYFNEQDFIQILKGLKENEIIYQMPNDIITLDKRGEKIVENYEFYAAFFAASEWKVIFDGKEVGQISPSSLMFLDVGSHILLAGKRWEILEIKSKTETIIVRKGYGKKPVKFPGGLQDVHRTIQQKMLEIYENKFIPPYISKNTIPILEEAFDFYDIYAKPEDGNILVVLEGSKTQATVKLLLNYLGFAVEDVGIGFLCFDGKKAVTKSLKDFNFDDFNPLELVKNIDTNLKIFKKFDYLLPEDILNMSFINLAMDIDACKGFCKYLIGAKMIL